ncbi:MAG TPA: hypothetical protein VN634_06370 [Candidatus Limnocylindrales bacterium]|nr:hypothetical protein [Candidatus Limnocylindrales bacterium]
MFSHLEAIQLSVRPTIEESGHPLPRDAIAYVGEQLVKIDPGTIRASAGNASAVFGPNVIDTGFETYRAREAASAFAAQKYDDLFADRIHRQIRDATDRGRARSIRISELLDREPPAALALHRFVDVECNPSRRQSRRIPAGTNVRHRGMNDPVRAADRFIERQLPRHRHRAGGCGGENGGERSDPNELSSHP